MSHSGLPGREGDSDAEPEEQRVQREVDQCRASSLAAELLPQNTSKPHFNGWVLVDRRRLAMGLAGPIEVVVDRSAKPIDQRRPDKSDQEEQKDSGGV